MKTKEELGKLKEEYTELNKKLSELTEEELKQVTGGLQYDWRDYGQGGAWEPLYEPSLKVE